MVSNFDDGHLVWSILTHKCERSLTMSKSFDHCVVCMAIKNKFLSFRDGTGLPLS